MSVDAAHLQVLRTAALAQPGAVERSSGLVKFQCPGCLGEGHDYHQDNACLFDDGRWGCAVDKTHWEAIGRAIGALHPRDNNGAAEQAQDGTSGNGPTDLGRAIGSVDWPLYDGASEWAFPEAAELVEHLLPAAGIVWWGGLPKRFKSLLCLYVTLAIACRRSQIARKFLVKAFPKILYVAREDSGTRLQERRDDIWSAWAERPEPGAIYFVIRPRLNLGDPAHGVWLRETCRRWSITMLVLDTWTALSPAADPLGAKDQAHLAAEVVKLAEDIQGLIVVVDHSRKNRPEGQPLSSADIFGPPQKWAAAEHIVMLDVVEAGRRLEVFVEGKDMETRRFFLSVSPMGSREEKFTFAGSVEDLAEAQRAVGTKNRDAILATLRAAKAAVSTGEIVDLLREDRVRMSQDTVQKHVKALLAAGQVRQSGTGRETRYLAVTESPPAPSAANARVGSE